MEQRIVGNSLSLDRERLIRWVRKWGDVNADGLLDEHCQVFFIPEVEGFIGYKIEGSNAIVFGDPTCSPADKPLLAKAFDTECQKKNLGVVYTIVSEEFMEWASKNLSAIAIEYGTTLVLDPHDLPTHHTGSKAALVRKKVKHALKEGIQVKEYFGDDPHLEKEMDEIAKTWVETRKGFQIYLCPVNLFENRYGKRWFYAQQNNKVVGLAILNELQEQKGWLLNNIFTINHNSNGLSELMIISVLEALEKESCRYVLAGPCPLSELKKIMGISNVKEMITRWIYKFFSLIFHLRGHAAFWDKFQPKHKKSFLLFPHKNLRFSSIKAILKAFNVIQPSKCARGWYRQNLVKKT